MSTKVGTENRLNITNMITRSDRRLRLSAAITPAGTPASVLNTRAAKPTPNDTPTPLASISATGLLAYLNDFPRSPCSSPHTYWKYCSYRGLSNP